MYVLIIISFISIEHGDYVRLMVIYGCDMIYDAMNA